MHLFFMWICSPNTATTLPRVAEEEVDQVEVEVEEEEAEAVVDLKGAMLYK